MCWWPLEPIMGIASYRQIIHKGIKPDIDLFKANMCHVYDMINVHFSASVSLSTLVLPVTLCIHLPVIDSDSYALNLSVCLSV